MSSLSTEMSNVATTVVERINNAGFSAYWAGGCVRDMLIGKTPKDYDIATDATPDQVIELFPGSMEVGKAFGVVRSPLDGFWFEIATFRYDHSYGDGRRPDKVSFCTPEKDCERRDFTINAIFYDPVTDDIHDFVEGTADIENKIIKSVGDPQKRFTEDYLRMLRAVRFAATLDYNIDDDTAEAIKRNAPLIGNISAERVHDELTRILCETPKAGDAIILMDQLGLLKVILPEVYHMKGVEQPPEFHPEGDVFQHTVLMLNMLGSDPSPKLAYSVLLHDIGKPGTMTVTPERIRFNCHASHGAEIAEEILTRLRFSNEERFAISYSVKNHMRFMEVQKMKKSKLRKMISEPTFDIELELHRIDCLASHGNLDNYAFLQNYIKIMENEPILPDPWITGKDIIAMGVPEGPEVGRWHKRAFDVQLEDKCDSRGDLAAWLRSEIAKSKD